MKVSLVYRKLQTKITTSSEDFNSTVYLICCPCCRKISNIVAFLSFRCSSDNIPQYCLRFVLQMSSLSLKHPFPRLVMGTIDSMVPFLTGSIQPHPPIFMPTRSFFFAKTSAIPLVRTHHYLF